MIRLRSARTFLAIGLLLCSGAALALQPAALPKRERPKPAEPTPDQPQEPQTPPADPAPTPQPKPTPAPAAPAPVKPAPAKPAPAKPARKPAATKPPAADEPALTTKQIVEPGPYITRGNGRDWTFKAHVDIQASAWEESVSDPVSGKSTLVPKNDLFNFENLWVVFPIITRTASSETLEKGWSGRLRVNDKVVTEDITLMNGLTAGTRLGKFTAKNGDGRQVDFDMEIKLSCFKTKLDEAKAAKVEWPKGDWPPAAKSTFQETLFLDVFPDGTQSGQSVQLDKDALKKQVDAWLRTAGIKDPRSVPPLRLAKYLAGRVAEFVQPSGSGIINARTGLIEGIDLMPIPNILLRGRCSEFDMPNLLVAVYRSVGLPARTVIGYEAGSADEGFLENKKASNMRAWAEFCLFDENLDDKRASMNWIPVDIVSLRRTSSRVPALEKPWVGFGTLEDGDRLVPFAFQFHPPTTVRAYGTPGFWGWMMTPNQPARAVQSLRFEAAITPRRAGDPAPGASPTPDSNGKTPAPVTTPKKKKP